MIAKPIQVVLCRLAGGSAVGMLLTLLSYGLHFNLSAATSIHLFLVVVIALRWVYSKRSWFQFCPLPASTTSLPNLCSSSTSQIRTIGSRAPGL
jgi:hypothetical protein